jgi:hypothetical protein
MHTIIKKTVSPNEMLELFNNPVKHGVNIRHFEPLGYCRIKKNEYNERMVFKISIRHLSEIKPNVLFTKALEKIRAKE